MNRKLILALPLLVATMLALSASAQAACPFDDPDCDPGGGTTVTHPIVDLVVNMPSRGTVTDGAGEISCGGGGTDCSEDYTSTRSCTDGECTSSGPSVTLTASGGGVDFAPSWSGCDSVSGSQCTVTMDGDRTVSVSYTDVGNPTVGLSSPPSKAGPSTTFTATASDNSGVVSKVDFYVDGVLRGTDTSAPFQFHPDLALYGDGSGHQLKVISQDGSGRVSSSLATAPSKDFTVDKSTGLSGVSDPPASAQTVPQIAFTPPADAASVVCRTKLGGVEKGTTASCGSPYTPQGTTTDGTYTVELVVTDDVGNTATITRSFTLDRGAPNLGVTGPTAGAIVGAPFTPTYTASDGFTPDGDIDVTCKLDSGAFGSCASLTPADGAHTLTVRATDLAGNADEETVDFTYDATAPVVKITAGPAEGSVVYVRSASFAFTATDLTAVTRSCKLDGGAFGPCTSAAGHQLGGLGLGIHTFTLRVVDAAGHVTTVQRRFTVANKPTDTGTTTPPPAPPVIVTPPLTEIAKQILNTTISTRSDAFRKYTIFHRLTLKGVPAGAKVTVTCKGKKCPAKRFSSTRKGALKLKKFTKKRLRAGTRLTIRVTRDGAIGKQFVITIRAGKSPRLKITPIA